MVSKLIGLHKGTDDSSGFLFPKSPTVKDPHDFPWWREQINGMCHLRLDDRVNHSVILDENDFTEKMTLTNLPY